MGESAWPTLSPLLQLHLWVCTLGGAIAQEFRLQNKPYRGGLLFFFGLEYPFFMGGTQSFPQLGWMADGKNPSALTKYTPSIIPLRIPISQAIVCNEHRTGVNTMLLASSVCRFQGKDS